MSSEVPPVKITELLPEHAHLQAPIWERQSERFAGATMQNHQDRSDMPTYSSIRDKSCVAASYYGIDLVGSLPRYFAMLLVLDKLVDKCICLNDVFH